MKARVLGDAIPRVAPVDWRQLVGPGIGLLLLGIVFSGEMSAAVQTWIESTAYNHCFLVIPIVVFLLWDRRPSLAGLSPAPMPWFGLFGVPVGILWLLAERLGIMEGRQLAAVSFVELLFLALLGWRLWWVASGPLLYLYFLVPFGAFLTPGLQDITTAFVGYGLGVLHIPAYIDGYLIEIPQGTFLVAEACAGLRFLIASVAFGCLYALMMYRSPVRRAVFILASVITPIVANGLRALGIVYLGYRLDSAQAAAADHLLYGWIFFSIVILLLVVLGLPFREDNPTSMPPAGALRSQPVSQRASVLAVTATVGVSCVGPLLSLVLAMQQAPPAGLPAVTELVRDCATTAGGDADAGVTTQLVVCDGVAMDISWVVLSPRATAAPLMQARRRLCRMAATEQVMETWLPDEGDQQRAWRIMRSADPAYTLATSIWIDGKPTRPGFDMRFRMAWHSLSGSSFAPVVMTVTPAVAWETLSSAARQRADRSVATFLQAHPELDRRVGALSAVR